MARLGLGVGLTRRGGGGGGPAAFSFADYGTPTFVMDANYLNGTDLTTSTNSVGDVVTVWGNTLGAGYPYYNQPTVDSKPVLTETKPGIWSVNGGARLVNSNIDSIKHMKFWLSGSQVSADLRDTHSFILIFLEGSTGGSPHLFVGFESLAINRQVGTNDSGIIRAVGSEMWGGQLTGTTVAVNGRWHLFEAELPAASGATATIRLNGVVEDTTTNGQAAASNINAAMMGNGGGSLYQSIGGKFQFHATYDITPTADGGTGPLSSGDRAAISDELMIRVNALNAA